MSVINRMLADLEARGAASDHASAPGHPPGRTMKQRLPGRRFWLGLLAVCLFVVAGALWFDRGPQVVAMLLPATEEADAVQPETEALLADAPVVELTNRLTGLRWEAPSAHGAVLVFEFAGEVPALEPPVRDGDRLLVKLPVAADGIALPSPPAGQELIRAVALETHAGGMRLDAEIDPLSRAAFEYAGANELRLTLISADLPRAAEKVEPEPDERVAAAATDAGEGDEVTADTRESDPPSEPDEPAEPAGASAGAGDAAAEASATDEPRMVRTDSQGSPEAIARRRYSEARDAYSAGSVSRARRLLEEAVERDPELHPAREMLVGLLLRSGDHDRARAELAIGLQHDPVRPAYVLPFARQLIAEGELERAARVLDNASATANDDGAYHALVATVARRMERHEAAIAAYTRALERDARQGTWWVGLGISLVAEGHDQQATAAFREARQTGTLSAELDQWVSGRIDALARSAGE